MKRAITVNICLIFAILFATPSQSEMAGKEIVAKAKDATTAKSSMHRIEMTLINKRGDKLMQRMVSRSKSRDGLSRTVTTFLYPDETKGTKFLMIENRNRDDDMKIFIPDLGRIRTISSSQRRQSYMGTDFAYGDLEALDPNVGEHVLMGEESVEGHDCIIVESKLNPKQGAGYSKMKQWIRKDNFVPIKTEYYDKDGELKKIKTTHDIFKQGEVWVLKKMIMKDVKRNHQTIIDIVKSEQTPLEDSLFSDRFLQQTDKF